MFNLTISQSVYKNENMNKVWGDFNVKICEYGVIESFVVLCRYILQRSNRYNQVYQRLKCLLNDLA